jgi:hypothetical protein
MIGHICTFLFYFGLTYFIAIVAHDAADEVCSQTKEEEQARNKAVSKRALQMAIFVAVVSTIMNVLVVQGNNKSIEEAQQEGIELVQEYPHKYIEEDVFRQYVSDNIADIESDYNLVSLDALSQYAGDEQAIYDQGWLDACDNYGIDAGREDVPDYGYYGQSTEPESPTAYITPSGNRYHLSQSCAGENAIKTTIADASDKGYTPCAKCAQ